MTSNPTKPTHDLSTHHLLEFKHPGDAIIALAEELDRPQNRDLRSNAQKQPTFELVLAQLGADLGVIFDGNYDADFIAAVLVKHMKMRNSAVLAVKSGGIIH